MDRILLLMTSTTYKAQAFLDAASRLGVEVTVATDRPQVLAALNPAGNLTLDFRDLDVAVRKIVTFAARVPITAVVSADDEGALLAAAAAEALGIAGNSVEAVTNARNKLRTRERLAAAGLNTPLFATCSVASDPQQVIRDAVTGGVEPVGFPCVLKPMMLAGSRGVICADDEDEFVQAFERTGAIIRSHELSGRAAGRPAREPQILIESYIPGFEVALEGLLTDGRLRVLALFDKPDPLDGPFFEETIYVTPSRHAPSIQADIVAETQRALFALGLRTGPVHAELRYNEGGAWMLELAPRSIGGLCGRSLRFESPGAAGEPLTLEDLILRHALGRSVESIEREALASGVMMIPIPHAGILRDVRGRDAAARVPGVEEIRITVPAGHAVVPPPEGATYLGFIFARGPTPEAAEDALRDAHARLQIDIEASTHDTRGMSAQDAAALAFDSMQGEPDAHVH